jgi:hypothetical protein
MEMELLSSNKIFLTAVNNNTYYTRTRDVRKFAAFADLQQFYYR